MLLHDWEMSKSMASLPRFKVGSQSVPISKETRRLLRNHYFAARRMARSERLRRKFYFKALNKSIRADVKSLRSAVREAKKLSRKTPRFRKRIRDNWIIEKAPDPSYTLNGRVKPVSHGYFPWGYYQEMSDYSPILKLNPPRNYMAAQKRWAKSFSCTFSANVDGNVVSFQKGPWALIGLQGYSPPVLTSKVLDWSNSYSDQALQKCKAKINSATLQMNEYVFEWKQFINLLKDPSRTLSKSLKLLDKWWKADAWIFVPKRRLARNPNHEFLHGQPIGDILMSMRTRRQLSVTGVSSSTLQGACNRWLQYRYGIAPLAADIATAIGGLQNPVFKKTWLRERARVWVNRSHFKLPYTTTWSPVTMYYSLKVSEGLSYSATQYYTIVGDEPSSYKFGLHPSQLAQSLWNAIPYSFVTDWIVNIDDWLSACRNPPWINLGPNCVTAKEFTRVTATLTNANIYGVSGLPVKWKGTPYATKAQERVRREIDIPSPSGPSLDTRWQTLKNLFTAETLIISNIFKNKGR